MGGRIGAVVLIACMVVASGCLEPEATKGKGGRPVARVVGPATPGTFITGADGLSLGNPSAMLNATWLLSEVGQRGPEPSVGVTASGCIFFAALQRVMRSCDQAKTWTQAQDAFSAPSTSDPYLWVDPVTSRVFNVQMVGTACTWIAFSDDDGRSWKGNPWDCGPLPGNDHIKLATGPWTSTGYGQVGRMSPLYPQAVYFCYNKAPGVYCYTSFDGGLTFPVGATVIGNAGAGGLHGAITTAPDGTVYVPPRLSTPTVYFSKDNGLTWMSRTMGEDVRTPNPRKNSEVATDTKSNAYHVWVGSDMGVWMSRSTDSGLSWDKKSLRVTPHDIVSTTFPHVVAGDPGRIAVAYLGSTNKELLNTSNIDGRPWDGNPHYAPPTTVYDLYVTISLNALDVSPTFYTYKVTTDPVQVGSICISSGNCRNIGGSNRNLLDFNDMHTDRKGRVYIAFADGCTGPCAEKTDRTATDSRTGLGVVAILDAGPSLLADAALGPLRTP